ncbi:hydroxypyruvate isomerase [Marinospirillum celere]|uniref:Hydroxypyruvate isomerase n=1 Tax=Marinospirillum celere TaxID=1122252 RepID=A0A1I1ESC6_9GAMM|nr:TIM barrel protein [Marinospirillum celere]SFB89602.1 hydroxypyruvate isomerase [Marinospirillum celere]
MSSLAANITLMFQDLPLLERIAVARKLGFQGVEVQFPYTESPETWQKALHASQMPLILFNLPAGDFMQGGTGLACHPGKVTEFQQAFETSLPYIEALKPQVINLLAGRKPEGYSQEDCLTQLTENLVYVCQQLKPHPLKVTCEPINNLDQPGYLLPRVKDWQDLAARVKQDHFGLQLDIYHAARMGDNPAQLILENANQLAHVQFADSPGRSHPGTGNLDWIAIWEALAKVHYQGWMAAEYPAGQQDSFDWMQALPALP